MKEKYLPLFNHICYTNIPSADLIQHVRSSKYASDYYLPALEYVAAPTALKKQLLEHVKGRESRKKIEPEDYALVRGVRGSGKWGYKKDNGIDALKVQVDRPVCLTGVSIWTPVQDVITARIKILEGTDQVLYQSEDTTLRSGTEEMQKIKIEPPVRLDNFNFYHIVASIRGSSTGCIRVEETERTMKGVKFSFFDPQSAIFRGHKDNQTTATNGQFPVLHFRKI